MCRDNFLTLEAWYRESISGDDDKAALDSLHTQILDAFTRSNMSFVDNRDFLDWVLIYNYANPEELTPFTFAPNDDVAGNLLSSEEATPITTTSDLDTALTSVYYQRATNDLEFPVILDFP